MEKVELKGGSVVKVLLFLLISYVETGFLLVLLALLLYRFHLSEGVVNLIIIAIYALSTMTGGFLIGHSKKCRRLLWGALMGVAYFIILLTVSLILNRSAVEFSGNFFTIFTLCIGGGMLGGILG